MDITELEQDITRTTVNGKDVILVGTAHISQQSVDVVRAIIEKEQPDTVCVELDEERFRAVREQPNWEELDLRQIIRNKQFIFLMARLALSSFQKRMGSYTGVKPGAEMIAAIEEAERLEAELVLCDRNVRTTLLRAWRKTPWWRRSLVAFSMLFGLFERTEVSEDELANLRQEQNLTGMLEEMGDAMPEVKTVLVDERDTFMADQIRRAPGDKVIVIIGAAHKPGIMRKLDTDWSAEQITEIDTVPGKSLVSKLIPLLLPLIVVGLFGVAVYNGKMDEVKDAALAWVLANGIFSALGAMLALAHPVAIITAFIAAPITSLNPSLGAGMFAALAQVWASPPTVRDMEHAGDDIAEGWKGWWKNKLTRLLLVFMFASLGSSIGTFVSLGLFKDLLY
jgi:pheromone shutdown-related protein TraB